MNTPFNDLIKQFYEDGKKLPVRRRSILLKNIALKAEKIELKIDERSFLEHEISGFISGLHMGYTTKYEKPIPWEDLSEADLEYLSEGNITTKEEYENSRRIICGFSSEDSKKAFKEMLSQSEVRWFFEKGWIKDGYLLEHWNDYNDEFRKPDNN